MNTNQLNVAKRAIREAVELVGTQRKLAAILGCRQQTVKFWLLNGLPAKHVLKLEKALDYQIPRSYFRPDIYPKELYKNS